MEEAAAPYAAPKQITYENTFITEPEGYGDQVRCYMAKQTSLQLQLLIVLMHILCLQVTLGQKKGQAMRVVSRCLWDTHSDSSASELYENETLYCVCQVSQAGTFHKHRLVLNPQVAHALSQSTHC